MATIEDKARQTFAQRAGFYADSACHNDPDVLDQLVRLAQPLSSWDALDIATGAGHTAHALAPHVQRVVATDITWQMLSEARKLGERLGVANVEYKLADAHSLPFEDDSFDLLTSRRAPHHFSDLDAALDEMRRVLRSGGRLVIDDRSVPDDDPWVDEIMDRLDRLHDRSHVRQLSPRAWWRRLTQAGFEVEQIRPYQRVRSIDAFTQGVDDVTELEIRDIFAALNPEQRQKLGVVRRGRDVFSTHWYVMIAAMPA